MKKLLLVLLLLLSVQCFAQKGFVRGGDISWITETEDNGKWQYVDTLGSPIEPYALLKQLDMNAIRLRVWVNPKPSRNGKTYNDIADVVRKAVRARQAGMQVMIDFHYSNWWADPGKQVAPKEWTNVASKQSDSISVMCDSVRQHTMATLVALKKAGVTPRWVQIGNEIPNGFMHPYGMPNRRPEWFAMLFKAGYDAAKEVFPNTICICHIDNGYNLGRTTRILDILRRYNVPFDMLGWSLYPAMNWVTGEVDKNWQKKCDQCISNADAIYEMYGKESMLVEVGMPDMDENIGADCIRYLIDNAGKHLHGLIWWEPLTTPDTNYRMGAMKKYGDNQCGPNKALKTFKVDSTK